MYNIYKRKIKKWLYKLIYGSEVILKTGLVVAPVAQDISMILANQMTNLLFSLGIYAAKQTAYVSIGLVTGLIGLFFS